MIYFIKPIFHKKFIWNTILEYSHIEKVNFVFKTKILHLKYFSNVLLV
jgi:hypothetical protein